MTILGFIYKTIRKCAEIVGFDLVVTKKTNLIVHKKGIKIKDYTLELPHDKVLPYATYAPWLSDSSFNKTYEIIKNYSLVDKFRCYELWQLVQESAKLDDGALIEVGVWRGGSGALIAKKAKLIGIKDKVYLCDTFKGVVKATEKDFNYEGGEHSDTSKETVEKIINKLKLDNAKILVGTFPEETSNLINDKAFRFCHIDVDVYQSAKDIVEWLYPKLVIGGIIIFDDYGFKGCDGITRFVNEERNRKDRIVIHNLNGHAIIIKISD